MDGEKKRAAAESDGEELQGEEGTAQEKKGPGMRSGCTEVAT